MLKKRILNIEKSFEKNFKFPLEKYEDSSMFTQFMLLGSISTTFYLRGILKEEDFSGFLYENYNLKIVTKPTSPESTIFVDWIKVVNQAFKKEYVFSFLFYFKFCLNKNFYFKQLKEILIYIVEENDQTIVETYCFELSYYKGSRNINFDHYYTTLVENLSKMPDLPQKININMQVTYEDGKLF